MLNKLSAFIREQRLLAPGDSVVCAVSGGADSMALLWGLYLLRDKLDICLSAAHFNHGLRGAEADRDEAFVREFCRDYGIPFYRGSAEVRAGEKGLEAAARDARYAFLETLPGKIATAHTADDNAETVLMHLVRGTGLTGLGAIAPVRGRLIRPMLSVTRAQVLAFLEEYHIPHVTDSSNETDAFLRNRLRHHVMPLLVRENPRLAENLSEMALQLRQDEQTLRTLEAELPPVPALRDMDPARRSRLLRAFLVRCGVREPERGHVALAESLVFSEKPSAKADFPGGVTVCRNYSRLEKLETQEAFVPVELSCPGSVEVMGLRISCRPAQACSAEVGRFTVCPAGKIYVRPRHSGDTIRLSGGTKSLKKLFIDRKLPAAQRGSVPVVADGAGVLGVYGVGPNLDRLCTQLPGVEIEFEEVRK